MLPHGPAFCFDLETTSPDPTFARPVEVAAVEIDDGKPSSDHYHERCTPGAQALAHPSYPSAAEIHGITAEDLADALPYTHVLPALAKALTGRAVVTYNGEGYDLRIAPELRTGPSIDVFRLLVKLREECPQPPEPLLHPLGLNGLKLSLGAVYAALTGEPLEDAHSAVADVRAAIKVLDLILDHWEVYLSSRLKTSIGGLTWEALAAYTAEPPAGWSDWGPKFKKSKAGAWVCIFGNHNGWPIRSIPTDYLRWVMRNDFPESVKALIRNEI